MVEWEYDVVILGMDEPQEVVAVLNGRGREGWNLVSVVSGVGKEGSWHAAFLKRSLSN